MLSLDKMYTAKLANASNNTIKVLQSANLAFLVGFIKDPILDGERKFFESLNVQCLLE